MLCVNRETKRGENVARQSQKEVKTEASPTSCLKGLEKKKKQKQASRLSQMDEGKMRIQRKKREKARLKL